MFPDGRLGLPENWGLVVLLTGVLRRTGDSLEDALQPLVIVSCSMGIKLMPPSLGIFSPELYASALSSEKMMLNARNRTAEKPCLSFFHVFEGL